MKATAPFALLLLLACGDKEGRVSSAAPPPAAAPAPAAAAVDTEFEPPDAQTRAEAVVNAAFNEDKTTSLVARMSSLIYTTSEVTGLASTLATREENLDASLDRLKAKVTDTEVVIQLPGAILFDFDSATIRVDADRALADVARVIGSYAQRPVRVEGHTDSVASDEYNRTLSERRARAVVDWLAAHDVDKGRLSASGLGETKPVATNDTPAGRQQNRRVEVVIVR